MPRERLPGLTRLRPSPDIADPSSSTSVRHPRLHHCTDDAYLRAYYVQTGFAGPSVVRISPASADSSTDAVSKKFGGDSVTQLPCIFGELRTVRTLL